MRLKQLGIFNAQAGTALFAETSCNPFGTDFLRACQFWQADNVSSRYTMDCRTLQEILPLVDQPSRYLGCEVNSVRKDRARIELHFALAFPDLYEIGMSHFGMQILYRALNENPQIAAERVFAPGRDMAVRLQEAHLPLCSLESGTPLGEFDIVGFSLLYELGYTNVLYMLELAQIPLWASERGDAHPLIIAGGPCTVNPEPVADFFDAMVVGDGEAVVVQLSQAWMEWKRSGAPRHALLKRWASIEGVYIPSFFEKVPGSGPLTAVAPRYSWHQRVERAIIGDLDRAVFPDAPVVPFGRPVHDRLRLEVARGCTRGCRFCQAGMIYRPVRERSPEKLVALARRSLETTGYDDISLLSLSTGDYGAIISLMEQLMCGGDFHRVAVSLPSLRADSLSPRLMDLVRQVRKTGFTIAPEAGSQRLRDVINKNISQEDIFDTVRQAFDMGWQVVKLYFMIGLPTETDADVAAIVELVQALTRAKDKICRKRRGRINVSVATFIPKAHTPFQWEGQISLQTSQQKIDWLRKQLRIPGVHFKWQNPAVSLIEGLMARGDRQLSRLLAAAYAKGCCFDGWSDQFHFDRWRQAMAESGVDVDFYTTRPRDLSAPLPWDHIDTRVERAFLCKERQNALAGRLTPDCRTGPCNDCGVCDFSGIAPVVHPAPPDSGTRPKATGRSSGRRYRQVQVGYRKVGQARYFGHLEMQNLIKRALRRAHLPLAYSEGFHPKPKISFEDPLPVGLESLDERFYLHVERGFPIGAIARCLNACLPEGMQVISCRDFAGRPHKQPKVPAVYRIASAQPVFDTRKLEDFNAAAQRHVSRTSHKGKVVRLDVKKHVVACRVLAPTLLELVLRTDQERMLRPAEALAAIFALAPDTLRSLRITKQSAAAGV